MTQATALALSFSHTQHSIHQQTLLAVLLNCIYRIQATSPVSGNNPPVGLLSPSLPPCDTACSRVSFFKHKLVHVTFGSKPSYGFPSHSKQIQSPAKVVKAPCDLVLVLSLTLLLPLSPSLTQLQPIGLVPISFTSQASSYLGLCTLVRLPGILFLHIVTGLAPSPGQSCFR